MRREATAVVQRISSEMWPNTAVLRGQGFAYAASGPAGAVSLKAVTAGTATWLAHGRRFTLSERMHLLLNPGDYTVEIDTPAQETGTLCVFFEPGFLEQIAAPALDAEAQASEVSECIEPWHPQIWPLLERFDSSEESLIALAEAVVTPSPLWSGGLSARRPATRREILSRVLRARDFMLSSLSERVVLNDAAAAAHMSPYHFHRAFREAFGVPPHRYLAAKRLERAAHLLRATKRPANEIALDCGFQSVTSFTSAFRKRFGAPPASWR
jgi:AraC family transcriptional regulator